MLALAGILIGFSVYNWNAKSLLGNQMPMPFGIGVSVVLTGSMEPKLHAGDLVIVKKSDDIQIRDIVVYQEGNSLVIHRVIAMDGEILTTQGDANNVADTSIELGVVKGELLFSVPWVGNLFLILKNPIVVILVLAAAVALAELSFRKEKNKDQDEMERIKQEIRDLAEQMKQDP